MVIATCVSIVFVSLAFWHFYIVDVGISPLVLRWASFALALGLLARAIGEFKYVGFFKRIRGSRFATLDSFVFSPICLLLAVGVALIAHHGDN